MKDTIELIDICLRDWVKNGINSIPGYVPEEMCTGQTEDDWVYWTPIESNVTDSQINDFENNLGLVIPSELRRIIKHKHFMELHIGDAEIYGIPSEGWQKSLSDGIYDSWPREYLIDKGYMPFANYSDWGVWCFNLNENNGSGIFPIYLWDHEQPNSYTFVADNLRQALNDEYNKS